MLTTAQLKEISQIIREHIDAAVYLITGVEPTSTDIASLKAKGIIPDEVPPELIKDAYLYGFLSSAEDLSYVGFEVLKDRIEAMVLAPLYRSSVAWLGDNAALYMRGLGNRIEATTLRIIHDAKKEEIMRNLYRKTLTEGRKDRLTTSQLVTELRHATQDFNRDTERVVNTELHMADQEGVAASIVDRFGADAQVVVRPNPDACDMCKKAYLNLDGKPRIFRLSDLAISNIDRPKAELISEPGKPPLHPHCGCQMFAFDPNTQEIDDLGRIVFKTRPEET